MKYLHVHDYRKKLLVINYENKTYIQNAPSVGPDNS